MRRYWDFRKHLSSGPGQGSLRLQADEVTVQFARGGQTHLAGYLLLALFAIFGGDVQELGNFLAAEVDADQR